MFRAARAVRAACAVRAARALHYQITRFTRARARPRPRRARGSRRAAGSARLAVEGGAAALPKEKLNAQDENEIGAGGAGEPLPADQGVDQGDPLSPALLAVTIRRPLERLGARLRELAEAEGYTPEAAAHAIRVRL